MGAARAGAGRAGAGAGRVAGEVGGAERATALTK